MNIEVQNIIFQLNDAYQGTPWFGRAIKVLLSEVDESIAFEKPGGQHSILELLWHMIIWREFTISRIQPTEGKDLNYFEQNDWRDFDHADKSLWQKGLRVLDETQKQLISLIEKQQDDLLGVQVQDRTYNFRKLLYGIVQHDIYHTGQIAYIKKLLSTGDAASSPML
ncbi:MAG: DinB family protein [Chitinophagaceae bacterium]|nr:DinB family protein [Chitinophagaceae bacterium]